jgi:N-acyl-D-amino-acid deacylase
VPPTRVLEGEVTSGITPRLDLVADDGGSTTGPFELLIRGGFVVDGTGAEPRRCDVGIVGERIAALAEPGGHPVDARAGRIIDASDRLVVPGFIDPHVHVEAAILDERDDAIGPSLQGVTTIVTAPDGFGWAPLSAGEARDLWRATEAIDGPMPARLDPTSPGSYLAGFEGRSPVNVLPQVPGAAVRLAAMGWRDGPADGPALDRMLAIVGEWFDAGAAGLAVGLDYEPGARAAEPELASLCRPVADRGGHLAAHIRYEDAGRAAGYAEVARLADRTGVRAILAHERLDDIGTAALAALGPRAGDIAIEAYGYNASSTHLGILLPAALRAGGPDAIAERLRHGDGFAAATEALQRRIEEDRAAGDRIVYAASADASLVGRELVECASRTGATVGAWAAGSLRDDPMALFVYRHDGRTNHDEVEARTWAHPSTIVASDGIYRDGLMHPRGYGTFPRMLRVAVREGGILSWAAAIHAMTGRTATWYRVPDRGRIAVGAAADIVVLDPATVADRATWTEPRLAPVGIDHVIVNGVQVVAQGRPTGARPGRVLAAGPS